MQKISFIIMFGIVFLIIPINQSQSSSLPYCKGEYWDSCQGKYEWSDGSFYEGEWASNNPDGLGYMVWSRFNTSYKGSYNGYWQNGLMNGYGEYKFTSGIEYRGMFINGKRSGYGAQFWPNGDSYEGQWYDDEMHGQGAYVYANGNMDIGIWSMGQIIEYRNDEKDSENQFNGQGQFIGSGSGFVINQDGYIVTNNHVIENCSSLDVHNIDQSSYATIIATDPDSDLAVIKTNIDITPYYYLEKSDPSILEEIFTVGYPFGMEISSTVKVNKGIISSDRGLGDSQREFQIDAAIQLGNSGGPVIDVLGNVVGVVFAKIDYDYVMEEFGIPAENMNFAVKVSALKNFLNKNQIEYNLAESTKTIDKVTLINNATIYIECYN